MNLIIYSVPKMGDMTSAVVVLQEQLINAGFNLGKPDGVFGAKTFRAVQAFQKKNGLAGSGKIGPQTLKLLNLDVIAFDPVSLQESLTEDLKTKKDRKLHPSMRIQIEHRVFPSRQIPKCFVDKNLVEMVLLTNEALVDMEIIEKGGDNRGELVGQVQGTTGKHNDGGNGDAWCLDYNQVVIAFIEDYLKIESPTASTAHCMTFYRHALNIKGLVSESCEKATVAIAKNGNTDQGHAMFVMKVLKNGDMETNEGNTSVFSLRNGDGSGIKTRDQKKNGKLVTQGFVRLYPNNKVPGVS